MSRKPTKPLFFGDLPEPIQRLARAIGEQFRLRGTWPEYNAFHVLSVDHGALDVLSRLRHTVFMDLNTNSTSHVGLHLWVLVDLGGFEWVFSTARDVIIGTYPEIRRTNAAVTRTREGIAQQSQIAVDDVRLTHLEYVFRHGFRSMTESPNGAWGVIVDVSSFRGGQPSVDDLFLQRPNADAIGSPRYDVSEAFSMSRFESEIGTEMEPRYDKKKVFVVHGHDVAAREQVARFLESLGLKPIILHEQVSGGRTLAEKIERHSDVGFAVVLLTPDDEGRPSGDYPLKPRARQNVILELGYFWGKLGRFRVCALVKGNVEQPSDYHGVMYVPLDDGGGWMMKLEQELSEVGMSLKKVGTNRKQKA